MDAVLSAQLDALEDQDLRRSLRPPNPQTANGRPLLNFGSNDYLGLASEPFLAEAASEAIARYGTGSGASRLVSGNLSPHEDLESTLACWKNTEAALAFSSGYATALGTIPALVGPGDVVILDKLCHACIIDGARLSGAHLRIFPHNQMDRLESHLKWARSRHPRARILIATESVFSMDGDLAPLADILEIKERFGAWLLLDEAHGAGVFGKTGGGLAEALGVSSRVEVSMGTLSKALGCSGGYVCGSQSLIDWLINRSRSFVFSTAPPPANAASAAAAVRWMVTPEAAERRSRLFARLERFHNLRPEAARPESSIIPWILGSSAAALAASRSLLDYGMLVPAIRYPTVPKGRARLRITLSAAHEPDQIDRLAEALVLSDWDSPGEAHA